MTGLVLAAVTAGLPLMAWGTPVQMEGPGLGAWSWREVFWRLGTFALLAVAVSLGILARTGHSRALGIITALYTAAVCLTGWFTLQQAFTLLPFPFAAPAVLLPQPCCCCQAWARCWRPACGTDGDEFAARSRSYVCRARNPAPKRWS